MSELVLADLSHRVLGCVFRVHNELGPGLLESAYEGALAIELRHAALSFERQKEFPVYYRGELAGSYFADLVVEDSVILELKAVKELTAVMEAQVINYLRISGMAVGYLVNLHGRQVVWRRFLNSG